MRPFRRLALDRRTFLRGGAACLALPWLDAMTPAFAAPPARTPRAIFVFSPNGMNMGEWRPRGHGQRTKISATLRPLKPLQKRCTIFSGLTIDGGFAHGDGPGDHARSVASFLTCAHPRKTGGADIQAGVSIDQVIAQQLPKSEPFASLELGMERGPRAGICDSGYSCAYSTNVSWAAPDSPVAKETSARSVFARLFGDPEVSLDREAARELRARKRSVLDLVHADAKALRRRLGGSDRGKLEQYLEAVRDLEQRLERMDDEVEPQATPVPDGLLEQGDFPSRLAMMFELIALALTTQRTRVITFMLGNGGSQRNHRFLGVPEGHHTLSHHGKDERKMASIAKIDRFYIEQLAAFAKRLEAEQDGEHDLLSNCLLAYGSGLSDGNRHNHNDLPMLLLGEGAGAHRGKGHVRFEGRPPMADLYLAMAHAMGCQDESFADSQGPLALR